MGKKPIAIVCPVCTKLEDPSIQIKVMSKPSGLGKLKRVKQELSHDISYGAVCETCKEVAKESVILNCKRCEGFGRVEMVFANPEKFKDIAPDLEIGQIYDIHSCPKCSVNKEFNFTEESETKKDLSST